MTCRYMIGYGVWNKRDMVEWLLSGVAEHAQAAADVVFLFDGCTDDSAKVFDDAAQDALAGRITKMVNKIETQEIGCHFQLMRYFIDFTDCDVLVLPQDDQRFVGPILSSVDAVIDRYGDRTGVIGGRDGYEPGLQNMISSEWSESVIAKRRLAPGEFVARPLVNPGPMIFSRKLISSIGFYNMDFRCWYWWNDYCHRASLAGFTNVVLGTEIEHKKFGKPPSPAGNWTTYYDNSSQIEDEALIDRLWGRIGLAG